MDWISASSRLKRRFLRYWTRRTSWSAVSILSTTTVPGWTTSSSRTQAVPCGMRLRQPSQRNREHHGALLARNQCPDDAMGPSFQSGKIQHVVYAGAADAVLADFLRQPVSTGGGCASDAGAQLHQLPRRWGGGDDGVEQRARRRGGSVIRQRERISRTVDVHPDPPELGHSEPVHFCDDDYVVASAGDSRRGIPVRCAARD